MLTARSTPPVAPAHILDRVLTCETLLYASDLVCLGTFACKVDDAGFRGDAPCTGHTIVFPRRAVWIQHEGGRPFVADRSTVPLYNRGQLYRRRAIDSQGDACEWLAFPSRVLVDALRAFDHAGQDAPDSPFDSAMVIASGPLYAAQRRLFAAARHGAAPTSLEEQALRVLDLLLGESPGARGAAAAAVSRDGIEEARRLLNLEGVTPLPLAALAARCGMSPFMLCRAFRRVTGMTISTYRRQLRLFAALERLPRASDLSQLALAAGFCSHSHFTAAFTRTFAVTPSRMRRELRHPTQDLFV